MGRKAPNGRQRYGLRSTIGYDNIERIIAVDCVLDDGDLAFVLRRRRRAFAANRVLDECVIEALLIIWSVYADSGLIDTLIVGYPGASAESLCGA